MDAAGLEKIQAAQRDGSSSRLDAVETLQLPADLLAALQLDNRAHAFFDAFSRSTRHAILEWMANAKQPETRAPHLGSG